VPPRYARGNLLHAAGHRFPNPDTLISPGIENGGGSVGGTGNNPFFARGHLRGQGLHYVLHPQSARCLPSSEYRMRTVVNGLDARPPTRQEGQAAKIPPGSNRPGESDSAGGYPDVGPGSDRRPCVTIGDRKFTLSGRDAVLPDAEDSVQIWNYRMTSPKVFFQDRNAQSDNIRINSCMDARTQIPSLKSYDSPRRNPASLRTTCSVTSIPIPILLHFRSSVRLVPCHALFPCVLCPFVIALCVHLTHHAPCGAAIHWRPKLKSLIHSWFAVAHSPSPQTLQIHSLTLGAS
jgi:hypothetical protein